MSEKKEKKLSRKELRKLEAEKQKSQKIEVNENDEVNRLEQNKSTIHDLMAPSGIDCSHFDYLEIFSKVSRFARTFYITTIPRQATFPYFLAPPKKIFQIITQFPIQVKIQKEIQIIERTKNS